MEQLTLFEQSIENYTIENFSANGFCSEKERKKLEMYFSNWLEVTEKFNRKSVSYQLSKKDVLHSWLKYKEGFSAELVNILLDEMNIHKGQLIMDPFMGAGTTAVVCQMRGINSIGYDVMPTSAVSLNAKTSVFKYDLSEIRKMITDVWQLNMPDNFVETTPYITITKDAYPEHTQHYLAFLTKWREKSHYSDLTKNLLTLSILNSLERISYTIKSGQYLGWDSRSKKVQEENKRRLAVGKDPLSEKYVRPVILDAKSTILAELEHMAREIELIQTDYSGENNAYVQYKINSVLFELPTLSDNILNGVVTSPPYCNRYDYTRTYALELVYMGIDEEKLKTMRQDLLSCTVENKSKIDKLREFYRNRGIGERFDYIEGKIRENKAFEEIVNALGARKDNGDLNNSGVVRMVTGYFTELAFVFAELYRICKKGAMVAFVNDNVRYGGEVIPVDFLSSSFAEQFGFKVKKIYTIKQKKGNSSQQMAKYGKVSLRKSITIWEK